MENTNQKRKGGVLRHLRNVFLAGILTAIPLVATYFVLKFLFLEPFLVKKSIIEYFQP